MNKKNNFMNNNKKKNNNNRKNNNNNYNGNQGFRGGGKSQQMLNQWNERLLMQRICDGAIVTLLTNAIAASSVTTSSSFHPSSPTSQNELPIIPVSSPPLLNEQSNSQEVTDNSKTESCLSPPQENVSDISTDRNPGESEKNPSIIPLSQPKQSLVQDKADIICRPPSKIPTNENRSFENPLLQTVLASILQNQIITSNQRRKCDKGTQTTERILTTPSLQPNLLRTVQTISARFHQQQQMLINNNKVLLASNHKFQGLAKTSSVYFTRGIRCE